MFLGTYEHALDDKNRVVLPAGLRKYISEARLEGGFVLAAGTRNQCLDLHPMAEWLAFVRGLEARYPPEDEEAQEFFRDLLSSAVEVQLDKQYRFLIPDARKVEAGIERDVYFVGVSKKIEIWAKERWDARKSGRQGIMRPPAAPRPVPPLAGG
jgi:transcriptional regulator MraZ